MKEVLDRWMKAYGFDVKMKEISVLKAWPEMMGKAVANRTSEIYIKNKKLFLKIESSVMRDELAHGKSVIIQRVNEYAGFEMITDVWFG